MPSKYGFILLSALLLSLSAQAAETKPHCYLFKPGSVEAVEKPTEAKLTDAETWCYQKVETPQAGQLIYMVSSGKVKPELSMFVGNDGYLTHYSLYGGKLKAHKVKATDYNPFSIPLTEPNVEQRMSLPLSDDTVVPDGGGDPMIEIHWFDRGQEMKATTAKKITEQVRGLTNSEYIAVVFFDLPKSDYFENGSHF